MDMSNGSRQYQYQQQPQHQQQQQQQTGSKTNEVLVLRPSGTSSSNMKFNTSFHPNPINHHHAFDSTLLTPLTKHQQQQEQPNKCSSPIESATTTTTTNTSKSNNRTIGHKSTSASYLLSKISSFANLSMPKTAANTSANPIPVNSRKSVSSLSNNNNNNNANPSAALNNPANVSVLFSRVKNKKNKWPR